MLINEVQYPVTGRNHYEIYDLDKFKALLNTLADKKMSYPVFVQWHLPKEDEDGGYATYWLETEFFRASIGVGQSHPQAIDSVFSAHYRNQHEFIPCSVYAADLATDNAPPDPD